MTGAPSHPHPVSHTCSDGFDPAAAWVLCRETAQWGRELALPLRGLIALITLLAGQLSWGGFTGPGTLSREDPLSAPGMHKAQGPHLSNVSGVRSMNSQNQWLPGRDGTYQNS